MKKTQFLRGISLVHITPETGINGEIKLMGVHFC